MGWADSYIKDLQEGKTVSFRPRGNSMSSYIPSGTLVIVAPVTSAIEPGSIVLCKVRGNQYLHFATAVKGDQVKIENAKGYVNGWTSTKNIYGILIKTGQNVTTEEVTLKAASISLNEAFKNQDWFVAVGIAEPDKIFVYVTNMKKALDVLPLKWEGYPLTISGSGKIRAL